MQENSQPQFHQLLDFIRLIFDSFFTYVVLANIMYQIYVYLKKKGIIKE